MGHFKDKVIVYINVHYIFLGEHRMEIEGFYCSYNKDPGINLSPPKKQTHAYKDISLQEAENDPCVNREGIELVQNAIHINKKAESKEEATSVIQMRQYHEEESDTDSGRGSGNKKRSKLNVGALCPVHQADSYWDKSSALSLLGVEPTQRRHMPTLLTHWSTDDLR